MGPDDELTAQDILTMDHDALITHLCRFGLSTEGNDHVLAARLIIHVNRPPGAHPGAEEENLLELPPQHMSADSPMFHPRTSGVPSHTARHERRDTRHWLDSTHATFPPSPNASAAYNTMRKWNLKFSGARGEDAETFLLRIEEGRELIPVSDEDVLRCLPFFLTDIALHWFRSKRSRLASWSEFKSAWRVRFGDPDFQFTLRNEIVRRTQGEHESVADYLTCMRALFDRLSPPWSNTEQLDYAHRNMLPRLQIAVRRDDVRDLEALEILATRAESSYEAAHRYRPPPTPEKSLFPDLAYKAPKTPARTSRDRGAIAAMNTPGETTKRQNLSNDTASNTATAAPSRPAVRCWNCNGTGHIARECGEERRKYCFRCGAVGKTVATCPKCSGNE